MNNTGKILITKDGQLLDRLTKKKEIHYENNNFYACFSNVGFYHG